MIDFWSSFGQLVIINLLAVMIPGPDFMITSLNSLKKNRRAGLLTALGIACALVLHVGFTLTIAKIIADQFPRFFSIIQMVGAGYLLYVGLSMITSQENQEGAAPKPTVSHPFWQGFLVNILNPKAALFFLGVFSQFIAPTTPLWQSLVFAGEAVLIALAWFSLVAVALSRDLPRRLYQKHQNTLVRFFGLAFIGFSAMMFLT